MSRLPCSACGGDTLIAVLQANDGLCARCVKGQRPCTACGQRISNPLPGGIYMHWECRERAQTVARDLDWKTDGDIDWDTVRQIYRRKLDSFESHLSARSDAPPEALLLFYTELNGGWNFNIVREVSDSELENYGDKISGWYDDPEGYDAAFALLEHDLGDIETAQRINARFLSILTEEVETRVPRNFGFPTSTRVSWKVHD